MKKWFIENLNEIGIFLCVIMLVVLSGELASRNAQQKIELSSSSMEKLVGNTAENLTAIKRECEKDLPRNRECVLVYDYVAVDKE